MSVSEHSKPIQASAHVADEALRRALAELGPAQASSAIVDQLQTAIRFLMAEGASDIDVIAELAVAEIVLASNGKIRPTAHGNARPGA